MSENEGSESQNSYAWVRLEPRCRSDDFSAGLEAWIADPLWMFTRQWQLGEFQGEDVGSPIKAELTLRTAKLDHVFLGGAENAPLQRPAVVRKCWRVRREIR